MWRRTGHSWGLSGQGSQLSDEMGAQLDSRRLTAPPTDEAQLRHDWVHTCGDHAQVLAAHLRGVRWWDEHGLGVGACAAVVQRPCFINRQPMPTRRVSHVFQQQLPE